MNTDEVLNSIGEWADSAYQSMIGDCANDTIRLWTLHPDGIRIHRWIKTGPGAWDEKTCHESDGPSEIGCPTEWFEIVPGQGRWSNWFREQQINGRKATS